MAVIVAIMLEVVTSSVLTKFYFIVVKIKTIHCKYKNKSATFWMNIEANNIFQLQV